MLINISHSFVPFSLDGLRGLLEQGRAESRVRQFRITGPGAALYEEALEIQYSELADVELPDAPTPIVEFASVPNGGGINSWRIESVNGQDAGFVQQVSFERTPPLVWVKGWAVDPYSNDCAAAVAIEVDGKLTQAVYGLPQLSVPVLLKGQRCTSSGFAWALQLVKGAHKLQLKVLSTKRDVWYSADAPLTVNLGVGE